MNRLEGYQFHSFTGAEAAHSSRIVKGISRVFSNSFGMNPRTGEPYRLGPKTTQDRLSTTGHVMIAQRVEEGIVAYLYGRKIEAGQEMVGWIDSLAVLPNHRRKGIATNLVNQFLTAVSSSRWIGCATPNPIAALVITRAVGGAAYLGECSPPPEAISTIEGIRPKCPDLRGADFNPAKLLVKTRFTPVRSEDTTEWRPPHPSEPPPWWASLANLPQEYEALLIIDRKQTIRVTP
jgi:GNAT superfamily N-acetyltransferase